MPPVEQPRAARGASDDVLRYRVDELERRAARIEEDAEQREVKHDQTTRNLERDHQATIRVVDSIVLKVAFFGFLGAAVATALINWLVLKQLGR